MEKQNQKLADSKLYQASLARLTEIFRDMSETVDKVSTWRCPYKSVRNHCTAAFGCRNQVRSVPKGEPYLCVGSDNLDYRNAWDIQVDSA